MNEWKELQIDNLPPDILTGDYEFEGYDYTSWYPASQYRNPKQRFRMIRHLIDGQKYRYCKPEPKQPTHEETAAEGLSLASGMTKGNAKKLIEVVISTYRNEYSNTAIESADIPPEAE